MDKLLKKHLERLKNPENPLEGELTGAISILFSEEETSAIGQGVGGDQISNAIRILLGGSIPEIEWLEAENVDRICKILSIHILGLAMYVFSSPERVEESLVQLNKDLQFFEETLKAELKD